MIAFQEARFGSGVVESCIILFTLSSSSFSSSKFWSLTSTVFFQEAIFLFLCATGPSLERRILRCQPVRKSFDCLLTRLSLCHVKRTDVRKRNRSYRKAWKYSLRIYQVHQTLNRAICRWKRKCTLERDCLLKRNAHLSNKFWKKINWYQILRPKENQKMSDH